MSSVSTWDSPRPEARDLMHRLRRQLAGCTADEWAQSAKNADVFSSGSAAIDRLLPGGGLRHGMLVEWLGEWSGRAAERESSRAVERKSTRFCSSALPFFCSSSAVTLSLLAAREACREGGTLVVIDRSQTFYPPAAAAWGIDLDRLIVVRPNAQDEQWAAVQSLRSPAVAAVWGAMDRLDSRAFRRLQLAAQAGRTLGLLLRPPSARGQPSWADARLAVEGRLQIANCKLKNGNWRASAINNLQFRAPPEERSCNLPSATLPFARRVQVQVLKTHGGRPGGSANLEIDDATYTVREVSPQHDAHSLPVVAELADPADRSMSARA